MSGGPTAVQGRSLTRDRQDQPTPSMGGRSEARGCNRVGHFARPRGREQWSIQVKIQGVPTEGVVDTGADITIIGGDLFRLKKRDLKKPDRVPKTYNQRPFALDGRMELDISFGDTTVRTPVYIKMDSPTPLLLSEGVCCQLGIITYHPDIHPAGRKSLQPVLAPANC